MGDLYDPNKESCYLQYLDANNLYGWAMLLMLMLLMLPLPTSKFKWVDIGPKSSFGSGGAARPIKPSQISAIATSKIKGYLLEVDVKYLTDFHDSHNNLPLMCDKMKINKVEKLVPNLKDKKNYVIHIRALDQALRHGLVLERINRAIEFRDGPLFCYWGGYHFWDLQTIFFRE